MSVLSRSGVMRQAAFIGAVLAVTNCVQAADALPFKPVQDVSLWQTTLKSLAAAVVCLGAVAWALWYWRARWQPRGGSTTDVSGAHVEWARRASPRTTLLVVRWQGRRYLLAENSGSTTVLDKRDVEEPLT